MNAIQWLIVKALLALCACATSDSGCDPDEVPYRGFCYYFYDGHQTKVWQDAEDFCIARKSHLTSLHSWDEHKFLTERLGKIREWYWIGLTGSKGKNYTFSDGTALDENPWPLYFWGGLDNSHCFRMWHTSGAVCSANCNAANDFICKKARGSAPVPPQKTVWTDGCGWWAANPANDFCYLFNNNFWITWSAARTVCEKKGGYLLRITDLKEQNFLKDSLQESWKETTLWMDGFAYIPGGEWWWSDGSLMPSMRWSTDGLHHHYGRRCLSFLAVTGQWEEDDCELKKGFICKKRAGAKH
ncbi:C-type mannose receptor 2-like isoform X1 [Vanacampus margaritifer]